MKPVILNDALAAVAHLSALPLSAQLPAMQDLLRRAALGHRHLTRYGFAHPDYGDGSLQSAVRADAATGPVSFQSAGALAAWRVVVDVLAGLSPRHS